MPKINLAKSNILLIAIIIIGSFLRLFNIDKVSLWHDEAFSALLIRYPYNEMIQRIILDVHPPLYYIMLRIWDITFGDSLFTLRFFSAFFGILTIYLTYLFVNTAFRNEKLGLIAAAFIAINPFQIQYATEARMYTLGTFLIMLSSWLLVKATEAQFKNACESSLEKCDWLTTLVEEKMASKSKLAYLSTKIKKYRWWILYGISIALAFYTHYYLLFSVAAQALFVIFWAFTNYGSKFREWIKSESIRGAIIAYAVSFLLFLPWIPVLLKQLGQVEASYWIPAMDRYSIPNTIFHIFAGTNIYTTNFNLVIISLIFLAVMALAIRHEKNNYKWLVIFSFLVPFIISVILSFKRSLYLDRYFVFVGLFYIMILASFVESIKKKTLQNIIMGILVIGSVLLFARGWQKIAPDGKPGMAGASRHLFDRAAPEDQVYINSSFIFFTYKYYAFKNFFATGYPSNFNPSTLIEEKNIFADFPDQRIYPEYLTPLFYTPGQESSSQIPHFSGAALLTNNDLLPDLNKGRRRGETVWLVWTTGFGGSKPEVPQNWKQLSEEGFQDVFDYRGWITVTKYQVQ
jgi:uncharacterized membrane protein